VGYVVHKALTSEIALTSPLKFDHIASVETRGGRSIRMNTEVGLLSRNIVIQGGEGNLPNTTVSTSEAARVTGFATLHQEEFGCVISVESALFPVPFMREAHRLSEGEVPPLDHPCCDVLLPCAFSLATVTADGLTVRCLCCSSPSIFLTVGCVLAPRPPW
jgi:hypothetical protein